MKKNNVTQSSFALSEQLKALKAGDICILATDTVYGIAAAPGFGVSAKTLSEQICELKERPFTQPFACLVPGVKSAFDLWSSNASDEAQILAENFWPGALTLVLDTSKRSEELGLGYKNTHGNTIALRVPADNQLLKLLETLKTPLLCTSANVHGKHSPVRKSEIDPRFLNLSGAANLPETTNGYAASTVIDCSGTHAKNTSGGHAKKSDTEMFGEQNNTGVFVNNSSRGHAKNTSEIKILREGAISKNDIYAAILASSSLC